tara:strand:+ start:205 stop:1497 length:1293 start_codon:yes stop_codon:yes gene_type:complete
MSKKITPRGWNTFDIFNANKHFDKTGEMYTTSIAGQSSRFPGFAPSIQSFSDASDSYANLKKSVIGFHHEPTGFQVYFKAFVTNFQDNFTCDWGAEEIFGRVDPVYQYKNTQRSISLSWKLPAATLSEGVENLGKVQALIKMLYPGYSMDYSEAQPGFLRAPVGLTARHLVQSPLIRLDFMNMVAKHSGKNKVEFVGTGNSDGMSMAFSSKSQGLLGAVRNIVVNHNLETDAGVFHGVGAIIPKLIEIDIDFAPMHELPLGWNDNVIAALNAHEASSGHVQGRANAFSARKLEYADHVWPYGINGDFDALSSTKPGDGAFAYSETNDNIYRDVNQARNIRDREADVLNAAARYSGLFGRAFAKAEADENHSAARGAPEFFRRRSEQISATRNYLDVQGRSWGDERIAWGTHDPRADMATSRAIKAARKKK